MLYPFIIKSSYTGWVRTHLHSETLKPKTLLVESEYKGEGMSECTSKCKWSEKAVLRRFQQAFPFPPPFIRGAFLLCTLWIQVTCCLWSVQYGFMTFLPPKEIQNKRIKADTGNPLSNLILRECASESLWMEQVMLWGGFLKIQILSSGSAIPSQNLGTEGISQQSESAVLTSFLGNSYTKIWNLVHSLTKRSELTFPLMRTLSLGHCPWCQRWFYGSSAEKSRNWSQGIHFHWEVSASELNCTHSLLLICRELEVGILDF